MQILVQEVEATPNSCSATTLSALDFSYLKADLIDKNAVFHRWNKKIFKATQVSYC